MGAVVQLVLECVSCSLGENMRKKQKEHRQEIGRAGVCVWVGGCVWGEGAVVVGAAKGPRIRRSGMTADQLGSSKTPMWRPADRWGWSHGVLGKRPVPPRLDNWRGGP